VALRKVLDRHGHGFHYALLQHIESLGVRGWSVEASEFPVATPDGHTHIDFVLRLRTEVALPLRLVAECKRANPALIDWCFVRVPRTPEPEIVALERVSLHPETFEASAVVDRNRAFWSSDRIYGLGYPIRRHHGAKGNSDDASGGRTALQDAVDQAVRGASGLIDFLCRRKELLVPPGLYGYVLPVVFTTARLWVSDVDLAAADLATGDIPESDVKLIDWLWLKQNISPGLKHSVTPGRGIPPSDLGRYVLQDYCRVIGIVSVAGVEDFLRIPYFHT
jgi:hypothetical protein